MARRVNYGFEKRQKEAKRKQKQAEKLEKKRLSKEGRATEALALGDVAATTDIVPPATDDATEATPDDPALTQPE